MSESAFSLGDSLPLRVRHYASLLERAQSMKVLNQLPHGQVSHHQPGDSAAQSAEAAVSTSTVELPISKTQLVFKALEAYGMALENQERGNRSGRYFATSDRKSVV